jgi:hypothetical protein
MMTHRRSHAPFHPVALHCFAQRARRGEAKARDTARLAFPQAKGGKVAAGHADTGLIDMAEFRGLENPPVFRE